MLNGAHSTMSRKQKIKHMSSEELKSKLYAHFERSGSLDHMRAQLRGQLVSELFKVAEPASFDPFPSSSDVDKCLLPLQVCNWLVYDHLLRQDCQYSLSTFVVEAQLPYPEKVLTAGDVLSLLGINHQASDFDSINRLYKENNELGFLNSLLLAIIKALFPVPNQDSVFPNQSYDAGGDGKMSNTGNVSVELAHHDLGGGDASLLIASSSNSKKQTNENKSFFSANEDAKSSDASLYEQLQNVKKESERTIEKLRHKLMKELESLHSQECKMHLEVEQMKLELRMEKNKLLKEKDMLKEKEVLLEKEAANRFEMKIRDVESEFASKLHFREKEIESLKMKLSEKDQKLNRVEAELASEKDYFLHSKNELKDLQHSYDILKEKYSTILDENTNLLRKFEGMSDYSVVKEELVTKSREVAKLHCEVSELHQRSEAERKKFVETVRNLEDSLSTKEPQLVQAKQELLQMKSTLNTEGVNWNKERRKLEEELSEIRELYNSLQERMEDQKSNLEDLQKTNQILNYKLTNNVINLAKSGTYRSFTTRSDGVSQKLFTRRNTHFEQQPSGKYNNDSSLKFLLDAKSRFNKREHAEGIVQEKYFVFNAMPEDRNKVHQPQFRSNKLTFNGSVPDYSPKPFLLNPTLDSEYSSKTKYSPSKHPYTLNDVKKMVSHSLLPYSSSNQTIFQSADKFKTSGKELDTGGDRFIDAWKQSETKLSSHFSPNKPVSPKLDESIYLQGAARHESRTSVPNFTKEDTFDSRNEPPSQSQVTTFLQSENVSESVIASNLDIFTQDNEITMTSTKMPENTHSSTNVEKYASEHLLRETVSKSHQTNDQKDTKSPPQTQTIFPNQELQKTPGEDIEQQSSSVFVNLDAAWQQKKSSISSLSFKDNELVDDMTAKCRLDTSSSLTSAKTTLFTLIQDVPDETLAQLDSKSKVPNRSQEQHYFTESPEIIDEAKTKPSPSDTAAMTQHASLAIKSKDAIECKSDSGDWKHSQGFQDSTKNLQINETKYPSTEQGSVGPTERTASADSLSEHSDVVHLSCGSETEQLKEDSDAW